MHFKILALSTLAALQPVLATWSISGCEDLSGCTGECNYLISAEDDQTFPCSSGSFTHAFQLKGVKAAGKRVYFYTDPACGQGGTGAPGPVSTTTNDICVITPKDSPIGGIKVVDVEDDE